MKTTTEMSPLELQCAAEAFRLEVSEAAYLSVGIAHYGPPCEGTLYADGICKDRSFSVKADSWPALFVAMRETWAARSDEVRRRTVRQMALEIIRLTAEFGECTDAALRAEKFTAEQITRYSAAAIKDANEMAGNGPFAIRSLENSNAE